MLMKLIAKGHFFCVVCGWLTAREKKLHIPSFFYDASILNYPTKSSVCYEYLFYHFCRRHSASFYSS